MALKKPNQSPALRPIEPRALPRDLNGLIIQLQQGSAMERRWASRDLSEFTEADEALIAQLQCESDSEVQEAIVTSLTRIGTDAAVSALVDLLRGEQVMLRNRAIEALAGLTDQITAKLEHLLHDPDPDVRIFCVNLMGELHHPRIQSWLNEILAHDTHINVIGAALEVIAEVGGNETLAAVNAAAKRFEHDAFIQFSADLARQRIEAT